MDRNPPRRVPRRAFRWDRPPTTRDSDDSSRIEEVIIQRSQYPTESLSLLDIFLDIPDFSPRLQYELPTFQRVFDTTVFERVRHGDLDHSDELAAWIHDSSEANESRHYNGSISLKELQQILRLKRYDQNGMPNADRRKVYLPNPHPSTLGILALAATEHQTPMVRRTMFKYFTMDTAIGLETNPTMRGNFLLEFHMPSYVWRSSASPRKDQRRATDNTAFRESKSLAFLSLLESEECDYLHECQTSISVTGWNATRGWTALCLADSYFDDVSDPNNEITLPFYSKTANKDGESDDDDLDSLSCDLDAISLGLLTADQIAVKDAREYFYQVVLFRSDRIRQEWINIQFQISQRVREFLHDPHILPLTRVQSSLATAGLEATNIERSEAWVKQTSKLLTMLVILLSRSVNSWYKFVESDVPRVNEHAGYDTSLHFLDIVSDITDNVKEMEKGLEELKDLEAEIDNFKKQLGLHVAVDGNRAIVLQHWNVSILQFFSPMALAGSIMQAGLVFGPAIVCFTVLTVVLTLITWNMQSAVACFEKAFRPANTVRLMSEETIAMAIAEDNNNDGSRSSTASIDSPDRPSRAWLRKGLFKDPKPRGIDELERDLENN